MLNNNKSKNYEIRYYKYQIKEFQFSVTHNTDTNF